MDKIFYNGNIRTLDQAYPVASAIAIKNGIIIRIGNDEEILKLAGTETETYDLQGKLMIPGFVDSHLHLMLYATYNRRIDLSEAETYEATMNILKCAADKLKGTDKWVMARSFNQDHWRDKQELPTRKDLDVISGDVPMYMERICGHIAVINSKALELLKLIEERPGSKFNMGFYDDGSPNGLMFEQDVRYIEEYFDVPPIADIKEMILEVCNEAASKGLVGVHSDDLNLVVPHKDIPAIMQAYKELAEADELPVRVYEQCRMLTYEGLEKFVNDGYAFHEKFGNSFTIGPIKIMGDGSMGAHTAALLKPYKNDPDTTGIYLHENDEMYRMFDLAHKNGFSIVVHCIGDGALEQTLNGFERSLNEYPRVNPRHGVIHCQIMDEKMQDRFREMNIVAYVQPVFVKADSQVVDDCVGSELAKQSYNWRRYIDIGTHMCGGSDCPVESMDPLPNLYYAITRSDGHEGSWYPENAVTIDEAVRMFTIESAYAAFEEQERGTLTVGKYADMVVLDKNIYEIPADELLDTQVCMTIVNGIIRYQK